MSKGISKGTIVETGYLVFVGQKRVWTHYPGTVRDSQGRTHWNARIIRGVGEMQGWREHPLWLEPISITRFIYLGDVMLPIGHSTVDYDGYREFRTKTCVRVAVLEPIKGAMYTKPVYARHDDLVITGTEQSLWPIHLPESEE